MRFADKLNPYAHLMRLRRAAYATSLLPTNRLPVPVISVGNITMGGTGKTPTVQWLARLLQADGYKPAIVLRGYRRSTKGLRIISDGSGPKLRASQAGDEAYLHAVELPGVIVVTDENRARGAKAAIKLGAQLIIIDDGFQHLSIHRDLNILLIDLQEDCSAVVPFGRSREPSSSITSADFILFTNAAQGAEGSTEAAEYLRHKGIALNHAVGAVEITGLRTLEGGEAAPLAAGTKVLALSAIAKPERFARALEGMGLTVLPMPRRDHDALSGEVLASAAKHAREAGCAAIVVTTKDAVKIPFAPSTSLPILVAQSQLSVFENEALFAALAVNTVRNFVFERWQDRNIS